MTYDGTLKFDTSMNTSGFQKGADSLGGIVKGLTVFKIIESGLNAIAGSIDQAVSRYDELNRFPKIMEQMGYGADNGEKAIKRLSDGIVGLPTTLNEIVSSTRLLTIATGGLDSGVDTALALNNAFFASGATATDASRGFVQYNQMLSKGTVDVVSWRTLCETMTYALQKTAETFGFAGASAKNDLYAALQSGEITFDQLNAKIVELNGGIGGFAEVAKTATGGIGTAWTNLKTAMVRGTANIIQSIDTGLSKTRFQNIENIINKMKNGVVKALDIVAKAFGFLAENIETIIPVLGIATGAFLAYKAAISIQSTLAKISKAQTDIRMAMSASSVATIATTAAVTGQTVALTAQSTVLSMATAGLLKEAGATLASAVATGQLTFAQAAQVTMTALQSGKIGLATAAQWLWNAAMEANPIGMIIVLVAALVAGLFILTKALESDAYKEHKANVDAIKESYDGFKSKVDESSAAHFKAQAAIQSQTAEGKKLVGTLSELSTVTERTSAHEVALGTTIDSLNHQYDGLNLTAEEYNSNPSAAMERAEEFMRLSDAVSQADLAIERQNQLLQEERDANDGLAQISYERDKIVASVKNGNMAYGEAGRLVLDLQWKEDEYNRALDDNATLQDEAGKAATNAANIQERALLNREKALIGAIDAEGRNIHTLAETWGMTTKEILAEMEKQNKDFATWSADNAKYYTKDGQNVAQVSKQWGVTTAEIESYINKMGTDLDGFVEHQQTLLTSSGMDLSMLAEKWDMTAAEVQAYCDEWGMSYDEFNEHMKETHTEAGLSVEDLAAKWGVSSYEIEKWIAMNESDVQGWSDMMEDEFAQQKEVYDGYFTAVTDGFSRMEQGSAISMQKFMENMGFNQTATSNWADNMTALMAAGVDSGVIAKLHSMGDEGKATAQLWVDELTEMNGGTDIALGNLNGTAQGRLDELSGVMSTGATTAAKAAQTDAVIQEYVATGGNYAGAVKAGYEASDTLPEQTQASGLAAGDSLGAGMQSSTAPTAAAQEIADGVVANLSSADFSAITTGIANAIRAGSSAVTSAASGMSTAVQSVFRTMSTQTQSISQQMMTGINTAITSRTGTVRASAAGIATAISTALQSMVERGKTVAEQMMTGIHAIIISRTAILKTAASAIASGVEDNLRSIISGCKSIMNSTMDGMLVAMENKEAALYDKAKEIADNIAETMRKALVVRSPSRVMIKIFEFVMMGIYKGMDGLTGLLYRQAEGISTGIGDRLSVSPTIAESLTRELRDIVDANPLSEGSLVLAGAPSGAGGGVSYSTKLTQYITTPKPLSESELTREGQDLLRRSKFQLP